MATRTQIPVQQKQLLRRELQVDGILAAVMGAVMAAASTPVSDFLGANAPAFVLELGIVLFVYGLALFAAATRFTQLKNLARVIILVNGAWVIASAALLIGGWLPLTAAGQLTIGIVAVLVAIIGVVEFIAMRNET
jgi:hypothetical protein